ncbi:tape measure protein [Enterococcus hulanensis]|uniref:tape measure protein n=1 Tax=Enterococcus hulanensis TaxID=2559929 RepID=UPI001A8E85A0|nr:tape measure protein [Enterococcus hulanensis]MBO0456282.1 tape measure protein [Enterococcus hulanensis]
MESYSVEAILSAVDKNFSSTMNSAERSMGGLNSNSQKANASIMDIAKGAGVFKIVQAGVDLVRNSVGGAIDRFDTLNKYPVVMDALGYSTKEVDKSMQKLTDGIDGLPTSLDDIVSSAQQLAISTGSLSTGTDTAIALNNAFLASGASAADAARGADQYRQMLAKGEVDLQSWRTLQETMPIAMDKVAKSFKEQGVNSVLDLYDALKEGHITFEEFNNRLIELNEGVGGFADLAKKNSKGIRTSFQNIKTAVVKNLANMMKAIDNAMKDAGLGSIADNLDKVKDLVNNAFSKIIEFIPPVMNAIAGFFNFIKKHADIIIPILAGIAAAMVAFEISGKIGLAKKAISMLGQAFAWLTSPIGLVVLAIGILVATFTYLYRTNENFRNGVKVVWSVIQNTIQTVITIVSAFVQSVWGAFTAWWDANGEQIKFAASNTWKAIQSIVTTVMNFLSPYLKGIWNVIKQVISTVWENIKIVIQTTLGVIQGIIKVVTGAINGDWNRVWEGIKQIVSSVWNGMKTIIDNNLALIKSIVSGALNVVKSVFSSILSTIKNLVSDQIDKVKNIFNSLKNINLWDAGRAIIAGFLDGIKSEYEKVKATIGGIAGWIKKHKGPISYDQRLLIPAGLAIMDGLNSGLTDGFGIVQSNVDSMADRLSQPFGKSIQADVGSSVAQINRSVSGEVEHRVNMNSIKQPLSLRVNLGNQTFRAFVEDISQAQGQEAEINLQF